MEVFISCDGTGLRLLFFYLFIIKMYGGLYLFITMGPDGSLYLFIVIGCYWRLYLFIIMGVMEDFI
jgi:hypothetical protein